MMKAIRSTEMLLWVIGYRRRYRVVGNSMQPSLNAGDEVLADPFAYRNQRPEPGDVVVSRHPEQPKLQIIKRISRIYDDGSCQLEGDNPDPTQSTGSRVTIGHLIGRVTGRFG